MTRDEAMQRVVEAAWAHRRASFAKLPEFRSRLWDAVDALDNLPADPAPETVGETVEVSAWADCTGFCVFTVVGSQDHRTRAAGASLWTRIGTVRLPISRVEDKS